MTSRNTTKPCANPKCGGPNGWGWEWSREVPPEGRSQIEQPARGRPKLYCSDRCRQMVHKMRQADRDRAAERAAQIKHEHRRMEEAESVVTHVINDMVNTNSRLSTTQRKALAQRIVRQLALASLIDIS